MSWTITAADSSTLSGQVMHGRPPSLKTRLELWSTPGIDGIGAMDLGASEIEEFTLTTISYINENNTPDSETILGIAENMQGQLLTVNSDDWGNEYYDILAVKVNTVDSKMATIYQNNPNTVHLVIQWTCVTTD